MKYNKKKNVSNDRAHLKNGFPAEDYDITKLHVDKPMQKILITGGAGFIGTNLAHELLSQGHQVTIFDNLSREGVLSNLLWLQTTHPQRLKIIIADVRHPQKVEQAVKGVDAIFHLAAQVAVTTSFDYPGEDMDINIRGTFNLLNAARQQDKPPVFIYTSTNKVYGGLPHLSFHSNHTRYIPNDKQLEMNGINESSALDFHSPYGCSKGAADQYVKDFARSFGIPSVVFRMSCIYGPHQCGTEDQGWVAHFLISALTKKPISIYGDGKQVRDILYVNDLVNAFILAFNNAQLFEGEVFNIGGGAKNAISLLELIHLMETYLDQKIPVTFSDWRPGDQRYYVSDIQKFQQKTAWQPQVNYKQGVELLFKWLEKHYVSTKTRSKSPAFVQQTV